MTRWNGSLIGVQKNTSLTDSTGVWNLRRQTLAKQNGVWPLDNSTIPQPNWSLDFSSGSPWSGGVEYTYTSSRTDGSATFINTSGQIKPIGLNLAPNTNNWSQNVTNFSGVTATANYAVSPSGETDATRAQVTTTGFVYKGAQGAVSSGTYTLSFYIKATSNPENVFVRVVGDNVTKTTQTITTTSSWVRYSYTITTTTAAGLEIGIDHRTSVGGPGTTCDILLWGAQVVRGSETLPYRHCPGTTNEAIPRLTHDRNGSRLGLLVEGQRTNYALFSQDFTNTTWWPAGFSTVTANSGTSPDGTNTAFLITEVAGHTSRGVGGTNIGSMPTTALTASAYVKKPASSGVNHAYVQMFFNGSPNTLGWGIINLTTGAITATNAGGFSNFSATAVDAGNGWWRLSITGTPPAGGSIGRIWVGPSSATDPSYNVNISGPFFSLLAWGAQFENSGGATSYIPTTTASVICNEDRVHVTKSKITNWSSPGAVCVHFYKPLQAGTLVATDNATAEELGIQASSTTAARAFWSSGQTATGDIGEPVVQKAVHYWDGTTSKFCINGTTVQTGTNNVSNFNNTNFITLGAEATDSSGSPGTFSNYANCVIRKVEFYAGQLTDTNLQEITQGDAAYPIEYLVVAGGGSSGHGSGLGGGGGGAGGYRTATGFIVTVGSSLTITVGAGGAAQGTAGSQGNNGSDSVFSTITSTGGGGGGGQNNVGKNGGSGGGGGRDGNSAAGGTGVSGEGNAGGSGSPNGWGASGGGGGAGAAGANGTNNGTQSGTRGGNGGNGLASSITGTSITRGGGGAAGGSGVAGTAGTGGSGGGGNGGATGGGVAGTANTGGGGGGGNNSSHAGGSGVVILRMPTTKYSGVYTGTPNVSQVGDDTVLVFNSSGSYRA